MLILVNDITRSQKIREYASLRVTPVQLPKVNKMSQHLHVRLTDGDTRTFQTIQIQFDWLNISFLEVGCKKTDATDVAEKIKPVYNTANIHRRIN